MMPSSQEIGKMCNLFPAYHGGDYMLYQIHYQGTDDIYTCIFYINRRLIKKFEAYCTINDIDYIKEDKNETTNND